MGREDQRPLESGRGDGRGLGLETTGEALAELAHTLAGDAARPAGLLERGAALAVPAPVAQRETGRAARFSVLGDGGQFGLKGFVRQLHGNHVRRC